LTPTSILLVTYNWPPRNAIGTHRPYSWARYWSDAGARVTVLTAVKYPFDEPLDLSLPELPGVEVIEVPHAKFSGSNRSESTSRRIMGRALPWLKHAKGFASRNLGIVLDPRDAWFRAAAPRAVEAARAAKANVVVSTYGPRASHLIASELKRALPDLFWVADYRDLWSQCHLKEISPRGKARETRMELQAVRASADLVTTVSAELADSLSGFLGVEAKVVANGFDTPLDVVRKNFRESAGTGAAAPHPLRIVYTGMIYPGRRDPGPLFDAVRELLESGAVQEGDIRVEFYGKRQGELDALIDKHGAAGFVKVHGHVTREEALRAQESAGLLLLLESGADDAKGVLTGKLFEYMASGRPILSLGSASDSAIARELERCGVGITVGTDIERIKEILVALSQGYRAQWFEPALEKVEEFTREAQAAGLLQLIQSGMHAGIHRRITQ
jgi:glycosyltransferase involved in cell wall biosynthesis